jgi:hypothetical protein
MLVLSLINYSYHILNGIGIGAETNIIYIYFQTFKYIKSITTNYIKT